MNQTARQLQEFADASLSLIIQRQVTFIGGTVLVAFYINLKIALICYGFCLMTELIDFLIIRKVRNWDGKDEREARKLQNQLTLSAVLSSFSVCLYIVMAALAEGPSMHLGPLFFLFAAGLYAAMNNCQLPQVLLIRMSIYTAVTLFIPVYDLWLVQPPLDSYLWKQLGVVVFVQYFVIECSVKFAASYKTGLKQLEELRIERDRVTEAYKVQSDFVSIVSHELRTPLTSIKGALDLVNCSKAGSLPEDIRKVARVGQKSCNRLTLLIDDLLDFQKLKSGKMVLRFAQHDLRHLVQEAMEANQPFADQREIRIRISGADQPLPVLADFDRLMQVMNNVLSNAIKFSHQGGVVEITVLPVNDKVQIRVRDYGVGIPENSQNIVFGPFSQIDASDKRAFSGTGLGMSITRHILESHSGSIDYTSTVGSGTTFVIEMDLLRNLPLSATEDNYLKLIKLDPGNSKSAGEAILDASKIAEPAKAKRA